MKKKIFFFFGLSILLFIITIIVYLSENKGKLGERKLSRTLRLSSKAENEEKKCFSLIMNRNYSDYSKALMIGLKAIKEEPENGKLYICIAKSYYHLHHYNKAIEYLKLAEDYTKSMDDLISIDLLKVSIYDKIGDLYNKIDEPRKALLYYKKALLTSVKEGDKEGIIRESMKIDEIYNKTAIAYFNEGNYKKAIKYDKKIITLGQRLGTYDTSVLAVAYLNLGLYYIRIHEFSKAKQCLEKGLPMEKEVGNWMKGRSNMLAVGYDRLAYISYKEGNDTSAEKYLKKALHYFKLANNKAMIKTITEELEELENPPLF